MHIDLLKRLRHRVRVRFTRWFVCGALAATACGNPPVAGGPPPTVVVADDMALAPAPDGDVDHPAGGDDLRAAPPADAGSPVAVSDGSAAPPPDSAMPGTPPADLRLTPPVDAAHAVADLAMPVAPTDLAAPPNVADLAVPPPAPVDAAAPPADLTVPPRMADLAAPTPDLMAPPVADMSAPPRPADMSAPPQADMVAVGGGGGDPGDTKYHPPSGADEPMNHGSASTIHGSSLPGVGGVLDVSADKGGGIWAVNQSTVYYWPPGKGPFTYNQVGSGLARGNAANVFASVAGAQAGEAIIGNRGAIGDHLVVSPSTGAVSRIENMVVKCDGTNPDCPEQQVRVTAGIRAVVDLDGTFNGTAYLGGTHGTTAWHGLDASCGCMQFQQHVHYIPDGCDSTGPSGGCWGGDNGGLAITPQGDLWIGDEHFVSLLPQRSLGQNADFFQNYRTAIDVFPSVNDEVTSLSSDAAGGLWVASFGNGLAYLAPMTYQPAYYDRARELPQNRLTAVAVDTDGSVWVGTTYGGIARKTGGSWVYYTSGSGLPSDQITSIFVDRFANPRRVLVGTAAGVFVYVGQ